MTDPPRVPPEATNRWVPLTTAADALGVSRARAYAIATAEGWRHTNTRPREYNFADVVRTYTRRHAHPPKEHP